MERSASGGGPAVGVAATVLLPFPGIALTLIFAFLRRWDRPVMISLLLVGLLSLLWLSFIAAVGGD
ncbi:MAG: hypothetical protein WBL35_00565 [Ornithinibacter sp.]